jgi:hypothetical protein
MRWSGLNHQSVLFTTKRFGKQCLSSSLLVIPSWSSSYCPRRRLTGVRLPESQTQPTPQFKVRCSIYQAVVGRRFLLVIQTQSHRSLDVEGTKGVVLAIAHSPLQLPSISPFHHLRSVEGAFPERFLTTSPFCFILWPGSSIFLAFSQSQIINDFL